MKKLLSVFLMFCLIIPAAFADEGWYYPFGFTSETTYDEAVEKILSMYDAPDERIVKGETSSAVFPNGKALFEIPINGIMIMRDEGEEKYSYIMVRLKDTVSFDGALHFLDVVSFAMENSKTSLINIEPHSVSYDINGDPVIKTFLDDLYTFADDFENTKKDLEYKLAWSDIFVSLTKTGNKYQVDLMFFNQE